MGSFWTGVTGMVSMATGGLTPIYGEPSDWTWRERIEATTGVDASERIDGETGGAIGQTAYQVAENPARVPVRAAKAVWDSAKDAADEEFPLWPYILGGAVVLLVVLK